MREAENIETRASKVRRGVDLRLKHWRQFLVLLLRFFVLANGNLIRERTKRETETQSKNDSIFTKPASSTIDTINIDGIEIGPRYFGPNLKDGKVDAEFLAELLNAYKTEWKSTDSYSAKYERSYLHSKYAYQILRQARNHFKQQSGLVDVTLAKGENLTVVGDIHGSMKTLLTIFGVNGFPSEGTSYLFNGDFTDFGDESTECVLTLLTFKLLFPDELFINRGNHESSIMDKGARSNCEYLSKECPKKYPRLMLNAMREVFNWLPVAHLINKEVLVLHGGLFSRHNVTLDDIRKIPRPSDISLNGERMLLEIVWSDPMRNNGIATTGPLGTGVYYGPDITKEFCQRNKLRYIIKSHAPCENGYNVEHNGLLITVHSFFDNSIPFGDGKKAKSAIIRLQAPHLQPNFILFEKEQCLEDTLKLITAFKKSFEGNCTMTFLERMAMIMKRRIKSRLGFLGNLIFPNLTLS